MKEPDFRDYHLLLDEQADVGATARSAEHADQQVASTLKNLPLEMMTKLVGPGVRGNLYDQGPIPSELPGGTVLQVRHRNGPCLVDQDFRLVHPA